MRRLEGLLLGFLILVGFDSAYADAEWFYTNLSDPGGRQIILSARSIGGHLGDEAKICPPDGGFHCYDSPEFRFAVPKSIEGLGKWSFGDASYEIKSESRFNLIGQEISVVWIDQRRGKKVIRFLYSRTRGLVGFVSHEPRGPLFLLENSCGFAASSSCME